MSRHNIGDAVRRVVDQVAATDLNAVWERVQREPVDESALRELVDRWAPGCLGYCRAVLRDAHAAEDVVSAAFAALIRRRAVPQDADAALRYLWRTVARAARCARWRSARRPDRVPIEKAAAAEDERRADPAARLVRDEVAADVSGALSQLSENERCAIVLVTLLGRTEVAAADVMGCSRSSVSTYLARAKDKLGRLLARWKDVAAAGGAAATIEAVLTASARAGSADASTAALVEGILRQTAAPVRSVAAWVKATAVLVSLCAAGTAVWATRSASQPEAVPVAPPSAGLVDEAQTASADSFQQRNLIEFERLRPRVVAALQKLTLGEGGTVRIASVDATGSRIVLTAELVHGPQVGHTSRLWVIYDTRDQPLRSRLVYVDWLSNGAASSIDPTKPIRFGLLLPGLPDVVVPMAGFTDLLAALDDIPPDPRSIAESNADWAAIEAAVRPCCGVWYRRGDPAKSVTVEFFTNRSNDPFPLVIRERNGPGHAAVWIDIRLLPDGRVATIGPKDRMILSPERIEFPNSGEWWVRRPR